MLAHLLLGAAAVIQGHKLTNVETGVQMDVVPIPLSAERWAHPQKRRDPGSAVPSAAAAQVQQLFRGARRGLSRAKRLETEDGLPH
jgi:hypothetical protein